MARSCPFSWQREQEWEFEHLVSEAEFAECVQPVQESSDFPVPGDLPYVREDLPEDQPMDTPGGPPPPSGELGSVNLEQDPLKRPIVMDPESVLADCEVPAPSNEASLGLGSAAPDDEQPSPSPAPVPETSPIEFQPTVENSTRPAPVIDS